METISNAARTSTIEGVRECRRDVAVVIPAHNAARFIVHALDSVVAQHEHVCELLVVDDGSVDDTADIVRSFSCPRGVAVKFLQQANLGPSAARNTGWRNATATWIQFLDADDFLPAGSLGALTARAASASHGVWIPYGYEEVHGLCPGPQPAFLSYLARRDGLLLRECCVWYEGTIFSSLIPRQALEAVGGFAEDLWCGEDYDLAARLALRYPFAFVDGAAYAARMHDENRHRHFKLAALNDYLRSIDRNLASVSDARARGLARAARARWLYAFGRRALSAGDLSGARECFRRAIWARPWKLGAWQGLLKSFRIEHRR